MDKKVLKPLLLEKLKELYSDRDVELFFHIDSKGNITFQGNANIKKDTKYILNNFKD